MLIVQCELCRASHALLAGVSGQFVSCPFFSSDLQELAEFAMINGIHEVALSDVVVLEHGEQFIIQIPYTVRPVG